MKKRGLSAVVTTLIIILLVLVAIGVVWVVIANLIAEGTEQVSLGKFTINMEIKNVEVKSDGTVLVKVKRNPGKGDLSGIKFLINDGIEVYEFEEETSMGELGQRTFTLNYAGLVKEVSIAPILKSESGKEFVGNEIDKEKTDFLSCLNILDGGESRGDGTYTIDPDGLGSGKSFEVYCDMETDGGGWTRVLNAVTISNWNNVRVNQDVVLAGTSDSAKDDSKNGWVGLKYWNIIGDTMRETCEGATAGSQDASADFSLDESNNYAITWNIGGNFQSWHNGYQLSTLDYDRDAWSSICVQYGGHEGSGWGWHRSCHIGSAWFGVNGMPICHVVSGATYTGTTSESNHVQWFIR